MRRSPILIVEDWVVAGRRALLNRLDFQLRPVTTMVDSCACASSSSAILTNASMVAPCPYPRFGIEPCGRSKRLIINYRTSRQIFAWSLGVVNQKAAYLDEGTDSMPGARSVFSGHAVERPGFDGLPEDPDEALLTWIRRVREDMRINAEQGGELTSSSGGGEANLSSIARRTCYPERC